MNSIKIFTTMKMKRIVFSSLVIASIICLQACKQVPTPMEGVWKGTAIDSTYLEVIISPKEMYSKDGNKGNFLIVSKMLFAYANYDVLSNSLMSYEFKNDSLILYKRGIKESSLKVSIINPDEVILE